MVDHQMAATTTDADLSSGLGVVINSDGSITRQHDTTTTPAAPNPSHPSLVLTKDITLDQSKSTWFRIYLPREAPNNTFPETKLPLIVYNHGGGFILGSAASIPFHTFCETLCIEIPAIVVSVEYRLAPEHRLPAAYDDSVEVLHRIKTTKDEWLLNFADFSNIFLMGGSAGANIAYHVGLRIISDDIEPLKIRGMILQQPFFGGVKRTESEVRLANDTILPLSVNDKMWEFGLPVGVDRDHEYCNPTVGHGLNMRDRIKMMGWKVMVAGSDGDPLVDRQIEFVKMLEEYGLEVVCKFSKDETHGFEVLNPSKGKEFCGVVREFILSSVRDSYSLRNNGGFMI